MGGNFVIAETLSLKCRHSDRIATVQLLISTALLVLNTQNLQNLNMQKIVLCTLALMAVALAAPQDPNPAYILKQESDVNPQGYNFEFETSDGISRQEQGTLKQISEDHQAIEVQGSYKYIAPDGLLYTVTFVANEHGFQPQEHVEHPPQ